MIALVEKSKVNVARLVAKQQKTRLQKSLVRLLRFLARRPMADSLVARYVGERLRPISERKSGLPLRLLVLNEERYRADLDELGKHPDVELISLPSSLQLMINAICLSSIRHITDGDTVVFRKQTAPAIRSARESLRRFLIRLLKRLAQLQGIDALVTCTFYYAQDREWEAACREVGIPFVILHKENMKDPVIHEHAIRRYHKYLYKFGGHRLFLFNDLERDLILKAEAASPRDATRISVVGGLRMDAIHRRVSAGLVQSPRRQVTLFSSHHCIGLLTLGDRLGFFSDDPNEGFVRYFDNVHATMARLAAENPDIDVWIKPKWMNIWEDRIVDSIRRGTGLEPADIPNLHISVDKPAQQLIEESAVVVGINSTTLLEAKLFGRPVVVPLFDEAAGKYYNDHVYFHDYLDDAFSVARSPNEMIECILGELDGRRPPRQIPDQMIKDYLGYFDGKVSERVVCQIRADIEETAAQRAAWKERK
jgi:hypothetical protein